MPLAEKTTPRLNPDKIPDLHWSLADSYHTTDIGLTISNTKVISTDYIDINTLSYAHGDKCRKWCGVSLSTDVNTVQSHIKSIICSTVKCTKDNNEENMTRVLSYPMPHIHTCIVLCLLIIYYMISCVLYCTVVKVSPLLLANRNI